MDGIVATAPSSFTCAVSEHEPEPEPKAANETKTKTKTENVYKLVYTAHHNWRWVVDRAVSKLSSLGSLKSAMTDTLQVHHATHTRHLPSIARSSTGIRVRSSYALFRVELESAAHIQQAWMTHKAFEFLDAKDALYLHLSRTPFVHTMPPTLLIPHDVTDLEQLQMMLQMFPFSSSFSDTLLKAALGSGGNGLYFVSCAEDILEVIKGHWRRAVTFPGFIDELASTYGGRVPQWSLQRLLCPVRVRRGSRNLKTQIRSYVVSCDHKMFLYKVFEVRLPYWDEASTFDQSPNLMSNSNNSDLSSKPVWANDVENEYVGSGLARPYNECRKKTDTERFLLSELEELKDAHEAVHVTTASAMRALRGAIESELHRRLGGVATQAEHEALTAIESANDGFHCNKSELAVSGVDLVVELDLDEPFQSEPQPDPQCLSRHGFRAYIVEFNNNPAMANVEKHRMSDAYREHLADFVAATMTLGLSNGRDCSNGVFEELW